MISLEKLKILTPLQKLPKNLGKLIVATGFLKAAQSPIIHPIWSHWTNFRIPPYNLSESILMTLLAQFKMQHVTI